MSEIESLYEIIEKLEAENAELTKLVTEGLETISSDAAEIAELKKKVEEILK